MEDKMIKIVLKLYVTGRTGRSESAIKNLQKICEEDFENDYELDIVDVLQNPQLAEDEKIMATPLLIKKLPAPISRIIGDLSDREKVLFGLGMDIKSENDAKGGKDEQ